MGSPSQALDAVDEAVYKGLCACGRRKEPRYRNTWLTRILINVCNAELKWRRRETAFAKLPETAETLSLSHTHGRVLTPPVSVRQKQPQ